MRCAAVTGVVLALFTCTFSISAADWPQWGGSDGRNLVSAEKGLPAAFVPGQKSANGSGIDMSTTKNVRWAARLGGAAYGNPTVADGRVFVGTDDQTATDDPRFTRTHGGMVKCFDEATGKLLWQLVVPQRTNFGKELHYGYQSLGVCSSPTVDGDRVYVVTSDAGVMCLDVHGQVGGNRGPFRGESKYLAGAGRPPVPLIPQDADIIWRYDLMDELDVKPHDATTCNVVVHGDVVYLSTSNGVDHPHLKMLNPNAPALIALDKRTGKLLATENEKICSRVFHCQWSSPSLGQVNGKTLLFFGGGDGICYAFETLNTIPDKPVHLKKVWSYDCAAPYRFRDGQPIPYILGDKRHKGSPNKNDGAYVGPSEIIGTPVFVNNRVYVAIGQDPLHGRAKGLLHCIDATKTGDITESGRVWMYDGLDRTIATPAVADGLVYIPDIGGRLHCVDADTGKPCWVYDTKAETWGSVLVADNKLFLGTQKDFFVFAAGRDQKLLTKLQLGSPIYSTPVVANGVLYVASQRYLWAVQSSRAP